MDELFTKETMPYVYVSIFVLSLMVVGISYDVYNAVSGEDSSIADSPLLSYSITPEAVYQGPVPEGYDLDYFRKTGETIK